MLLFGRILFLLWLLGRCQNGDNIFLGWDNGNSLLRCWRINRRYNLSDWLGRLLLLLVNHNILYVLIRVLVRHPLIAIIILVEVVCWRVILETLHAGCP